MDSLLSFCTSLITVTLVEYVQTLHLAHARILGNFLLNDKWYLFLSGLICRQSTAQFSFVQNALTTFVIFSIKCYEQKLLRQLLFK